MVAMMLLMSGTGILLSFPTLSRPIFGTLGGPAPAGGMPMRAQGRHGVPHDPAVGLDAALVRVAAARPDAKIVFVSLGNVFQLRLRLPDGHIVMGAIGHDGDAQFRLQGARHGNTGLMWLHGLHQANLPLRGWAARAWSVAVGAAGLSLVLFALTGFAYWLSRQRRRSRGGVPAVLPAAES